MLSDDSSSDSETGRFKCQTKSTDDKQNGSKKREENRDSSRRRRHSNDRNNRQTIRHRDERDKYERHSRDRSRYSRYSPVRRRSHDRGRSRRSSERHRHSRNSRERSKPKDYHSNSKDRDRHSRSRSHRSQNRSRNLKEEIKDIIGVKDKKVGETDKPYKKLSLDKKLSSPDVDVVKKSVVLKPTISETKPKSESPILIDEHEHSDTEIVQPGSYYKMIPAVPKEIQKSEESSEIDSSDDEKLRAKLLNIEKQLQKTKKKKHKKRHKRKTFKSDKDKGDSSASVEVSSTTDIKEVKIDKPNNLSDVVEVTSTQKSNQRESSEEGEILSDDSQSQIEIDPNDLRHKLKRSKADSQEARQSKLDVCGPALPPHLEKRFRKSVSPSTPSLSPTQCRSNRNIGPSIPDDMRKVLAESSHEVIKCISSDEDGDMGPLPANSKSKQTEAHILLEERATEMKIRQLEGRSLQTSNIKSREQWMLELPEGKAKYIGLEARSFRAKEGPDMSDRSTWTDTPEEKARKAAGIVKEEDSNTALQREARARHIATRDDDQEKAIRKHKKKHKREESLLELHQKKLKKKKKKDEKEEKKDRRPFSRETDLQVNRFDEAQKKSIIKKAQDLNSRFSRGEAKYL